MNCSSQQLLPAIQSQAKTKLPTADYFSTWQLDLYNKLDGGPGEIQNELLHWDNSNKAQPKLVATQLAVFTML